MKKIIFLFVLVPALAFGQTQTSNQDLKKSAETFVVKYFKAMQDQKWDEVLNSISEDAELITTDHVIKPLYKSMTTAIENDKKNNITRKYTITSISADILSPTSSLVTVMCLSTRENNSNPIYRDNLGIYLLELKNGSWKIKKSIPQENYPVTFSDKVDPKMRTGILGPLPRFTGALNQMNGLFMFAIEDYKAKGISPGQLGTTMGKRYAQGWDSSRGFEGLVSSVYGIMQVTCSEMEVLEKNDNILKIKYLNNFLPGLTFWNLTNKEIVDMFNNLFVEVADHMGGNSSIVEDGKYLVLTLTKK